MIYGFIISNQCRFFDYGLIFFSQNPRFDLQPLELLLLSEDMAAEHVDLFRQFGAHELIARGVLIELELLGFELALHASDGALKLIDLLGESIIMLFIGVIPSAAIVILRLRLRCDRLLRLLNALEEADPITLERTQALMKGAAPREDARTVLAPAAPTGGAASEVVQRVADRPACGRRGPEAPSVAAP